MPPKPPSTMTLRPNLARVGYQSLAEFTSTNWATLQAAEAASKFSMSRPNAEPGVTRAIVPTHPFSQWPLVRVRARPGRRYLLRADINLFYSSIYTHCVPWALHTTRVMRYPQERGIWAIQDKDRHQRRQNIFYRT